MQSLSFLAPPAVSGEFVPRLDPDMYDSFEMPRLDPDVYDSFETPMPKMLSLCSA